VCPYTGHIWGYRTSSSMPIEAAQALEVHAIGLASVLRRNIVESNLNPQ